MKKRLIITGVVFVCLFLASVPYCKAESLMSILGLDQIPRKASVARQLGVYPVFEHNKKSGKNRLYVTLTPPVCVKAAEEAAARKAAGIIPEKAVAKVSTVDFKIKHTEKTVKIIDGNGDKNYANAFWEQVGTKSKLYDIADTTFDGNLQIQVQCGATIYTTTLSEGDKSPWDDGVTPVTDTFEKGSFQIKDQYWPRVTTKGPDGKIKNDVTLKMKWKPGMIQIQYTIKGPRNLPFLSDNTDITDPANDADGDISVTINTFSIALVKDSGAGSTVGTWSLTGVDIDGKKKTKVQKKKLPDGTIGYYVLVNYKCTLRKQTLDYTP